MLTKRGGQQSWTKSYCYIDGQANREEKVAVTVLRSRSVIRHVPNILVTNFCSLFVLALIRLLPK